MSDLKDAIRYAIFEKIRVPDSDISETVMFIRQNLIERNRIVPDFESKEKFSIGLIVPISLPPGSKPGHCFRVVQEIEKQFNLLGGGSTTYETRGSWLDEKGDTIQDKSIKISTEMLLKDWYIAIDVLRSLIENEIQLKLRQKCVLLYVDSQTFGEPINLVGDSVDIFPTQSAFGEEDPDLVEYVREKESAQSSISVHQSSNGSDNIQISTQGNATININSNPQNGANFIQQRHQQSLDDKKRNERKISNKNDRLPSPDDGEEILREIFTQFEKHHIQLFLNDLQEIDEGKYAFELENHASEPLMLSLEQFREFKELEIHRFLILESYEVDGVDIDVEEEKSAVLCHHITNKFFLFMVFWNQFDDERKGNSYFRSEAKMYCPAGFSISKNRFSFGRLDGFKYNNSQNMVIFGIEIVKDGK